MILVCQWCVDCRPDRDPQIFLRTRLSTDPMTGTVCGRGRRHTRDDCKLGGWGAALSVLTADQNHNSHTCCYITPVWALYNVDAVKHPAEHDMRASERSSSVRRGEWWFQCLTASCWSLSVSQPHPALSFHPKLEAARIAHAWLNFCSHWSVLCSAVSSLSWATRLADWMWLAAPMKTRVHSREAEPLVLVILYWTVTAYCKQLL